MRHTTVVALVGTLGVCGPSAPERPLLAQPQLEFTVTGAGEAAGPDTATVGDLAPGAVVIDGRLSTPTPCYNVTGALVEEPGDLVLRVTATRQDGGCIQVIGAFTYEARISQLAPGSRTITVVHTYPSTGWEERTYTLQARIP